MLLNLLCRDGCDRLVTMTRDEMKRVALQQCYGWHPGFRVFAGDIRERERLADAFAHCEVVIHCAARKRIDAHFDEPAEMLHTNVLGTQNVLWAARQAGVRKVLFISSDKAVNSENCYGTSKAMAEYLVIANNARSFASGMRSSVIRYGNVLSSTGSVVRVWREKAARGEPLPISDRRMTRFWLTLDQAACCVLKAIGDLRGGEVFVPLLKAAPLTRILEAIAPGAETVDCGIRQGGEKLHESLVSEDEARRARKRNGWLIVQPPDTEELWDRAPWLGEPVPEDFTYRSDTWPEQWTTEALREVLV
jgi:UDP-N-acetylglucosamine 4,6-dehydratase